MSKITPEFVRWLLWNQGKLRDSLEPGAGVSNFKAIITTRDGGSKVERVAINNMAISAVISALDRAYKAMHPEHKRLYKYRFRDAMSYNEITRRMDISPDSVGRRISEISEIVAAFLEAVPEDQYREFSRFVDANL